MIGEIPWNSLRTRAREQLAHAYAPYSRFPVGAAGLWRFPAAGEEDHSRLGAPGAAFRIIGGSNIENASYGLTLCAECSVISTARSGGAVRLVALSCVSGDGELLMPCGRCRQLLFEHGGPELLVDHPAGPKSMAELLPDAFGPANLE